jgi:cyclic beta-1,2-glucan synthetase
MGAHDWNDGMNRVGIHGQGESIWLGWFLFATLNNFADICELMSDHKRTQEYRSQANTILKALAATAWDGEWYRRAYYDDGSPLGSAENNECKIDAIAQSWAVLSGGAVDERSRRAMQSVYEQLVRPEDELILLFSPPFERTPRDPGYIKGYPPGIRENGGQYTHAAIWSIWAFAQLGQGDRAVELFHLINPVYHADTLEKVSRYRVEPYVVAADVYSRPPHTGRGGWTWYTGSASWLYRLGVEAILGVSRTGNTLKIDPCIHRDWHEYKIEYRLGKTMYHIHVKNPQGVNGGASQVVMDGKMLNGVEIPLLDDEQTHEVVITLR